MKTLQKGRKTPPKATKTIRLRIEKGGERIWRMEDFHDLPPAAAAQALSRLTKAGFIRRLSKGTYYRSRDSVFGKTHPNPSAISKLASRRKSIFPAGTAAANYLGFTTQTPSKGELSTSAGSLPRKLLEPQTIIHTRRPDAWKHLSITEAAILEFIRRGGRDTELSPDDTVQRMRELITKAKAFKKLLKVAPSEPARVRAILGALGEKMVAEKKDLAELRRSLNPLSKFNFGNFAALPNAKNWQARRLR